MVNQHILEQQIQLIIDKLSQRVKDDSDNGEGVVASGELRI